MTVEEIAKRVGARCTAEFGEGRMLAPRFNKIVDEELRNVDLTLLEGTGLPAVRLEVISLVRNMKRQERMVS